MNSKPIWHPPLTTLKANNDYNTCIQANRSPLTCQPPRPANLESPKRSTTWQFPHAQTPRS